VESKTHKLKDMLASGIQDTIELARFKERVKSAKKGKYNITVPIPFAFDIREKTRPKSIKEKRAELEIEQRETEEREKLNTVFRSKPIPNAVLEPRYEKIMEANERRR